MRFQRQLCVVVGLAMAACSDDGTNPGKGSGTLLVEADVSYDEGGAAARISVRRAGQDVNDAVVTLSSSLGDVVLVRSDGGVYFGRQAGWKGSYGITVVAGPNGVDHLDGAVATPSAATLTRPTPGVAFDPHTAARDGMIEVAWSGERAEMIRVRTKEYKPGYVVDEGKLLLAATFFVESHQEIELDRQNSVDLAGGAPGSTLAAHFGTKTEITVSNPY